MMSEITADVARALLDYDPVFGFFWWKERAAILCRSAAECMRWNRRYAGSRAGRTASDGYVIIKIYGRGYGAHRLAWLLVTGDFPDAEIDHVNGVRGDNRFSNLRQATRSENMANVPVIQTNTSGKKGVCFHKQSRKWQAQIGVDGEKIYLGLFDDLSAAAEAYESAARKYFGAFARIGA